MTWKALFVLAALGTVVVAEGRLLPRDAGDATFEAELGGTPIAGRIPSGSAIFERDADALVARVDISALDLPQGTELDSWLNDRANAPCEGRHIGTALLDSGGSAAWRLSGRSGLVDATDDGSFVSVCAGAAPMLSGNLRAAS